MKKLIFLLILAVALAGVMFAGDAACPPGVLTLEAALSGNSVDSRAVTPDTVLDLALPVTAGPSSILTVMALNDETAMRPHSGYDAFIDTGQTAYSLRL